MNGLPRKMKTRIFLFSLFLMRGAFSLVMAEIAIDANYAGGNARILTREASTFTVAPDLRDTEGWWFYFNFRLRGQTEQPVSVSFAERNPIGVRGPAMSLDGGKTWRWLGKHVVTKTVAENRTSWSFPTSLPRGVFEARFAFAPTYLESHLHEWLTAHRTNLALQVAELCFSRQGRAVELIHAGCLDLEKARGVVLLTSRHHACESVATYALEGLISAAVADDAIGRRWRSHWLIIAVPFMDKDGVEAGDQGKNRAPHDHNRDYSDTPLYPEVAAWMRLGESVRDRVVFSLDLHCPYISGPWNDHVYFVGGSDPSAAVKERAFARVLERVAHGPLRFRAENGYLPWGTAWNKGSNTSAGRSNGTWARTTFPKARFAGSIEIPYADVLGVEVNADSARALGRDLAEAILEHLE